MPADRILLVFIHGFLGSDESFLAFPRALSDRLSHVVSVEVKVYPKYDTKGNNAVQGMEERMWETDRCLLFCILSICQSVAWLTGFL